MARTKKEEVATEETAVLTGEEFTGELEEKDMMASSEEKEEEFDIPDSEQAQETEQPSEETEEDAADANDKKSASADDTRPDRIQVASRRQKRKIYHTEAVFTEEGLTKATIQETEKHKEYIELAASVKEQTVLRGRLIGITKLLKDGTETPIPFGEVEYKKYWTVYIPAHVLFDSTIQPPEVVDALKATEKDKRNSAFKNVMNRRINAPVDFIANYINEKDGYATGSHIWAMSRRSLQYYATPRRDGKPDITSGMIVRGTVVQVNSYGIYVDLFGAETFIPNTELSWNQISDVREYYDVGSEIDVRILSIKQKMLYDGIRNKEYRVAKVTASVKQITEDPNKVYFDEIEIGDSGLGEVTQVTEFGIFALFKNKVQVKCGLYDGGNGTQPLIGDELRIEITKKGIDKESGRYTYNGTIKHCIRKAVVRK